MHSSRTPISYAEMVLYPNMHAISGDAAGRGGVARAKRRLGWVMLPALSETSVGKECAEATSLERGAVRLFYSSTKITFIMSYQVEVKE